MRPSGCSVTMATARPTVADIARDLGMSPANIYRFFASKVEIHQAICGRMLGRQLQAGLRHLAACRSAPRSGCGGMCMRQYQMTLDTMLDEEKVHEMVIVAIERDWHVIEKHIDRIHDLIAEVIREGIAAGEFAEQDPESPLALLRRGDRQSVPSADGGAVSCQDQPGNARRTDRICDQGLEITLTAEAVRNHSKRSGVRKMFSLKTISNACRPSSASRSSAHRPRRLPAAREEKRPRRRKSSARSRSSRSPRPATRARSTIPAR